jgi:hypothetical protein
MNERIVALGIVVMLAVAGCGGPKAGSEVEGESLWITPDIAQRRAQFEPIPMEADLSVLSAGDRQALEHLVKAAHLVDRVFFRQAWAGNPEFEKRVAALTGPLAGPARDYYRIMYGPWDRLDGSSPFLGRAPHPKGAGFYPEDMAREEFEEWIEAHPGQRDAFMSLTTVIRRTADGLEAVPYSQEYRDLLQPAAEELEAAAAATDNASLKRFLELRAEAFRTDDYYQSDLAWMDLDSPLEVVIGPYETYEDGLFGYKAAFEAFICLAQPEDSQRLAVYKGELPYLERHLPIPDEHKNLDRGTESPIRVADEILTAGDARAGVQTLAFNLPNDERVREAKGSKKVLLKNMMRAKYDAILKPIAAHVLPADEQDELYFDSYFHFILFHELAHGLGPGRIVKDGRQTEVRLELKDLYSAMEEAKADVVGASNLYLLAGKGVVPAAVVEHLPWTYVAGLFRSARFGITEAHGLGVVLQFNWLTEHGAIRVTEDGRFQPVPEKFHQALEGLAHEILMAQALGSYTDARKLIDRYGAPSETMKALLSGLEGVPVDVDPIYPVEQVQP